MIQPHSPAQQQHPPTVAPNVLHFNPATRQLNAASIFQRLGLSDPQTPEAHAQGQGQGQAREDSHLADADFDGLGHNPALDDVTTPRPGTGSGATSYLDAVSPPTADSIASRLGNTGSASLTGNGTSQRSTVQAGAAPQHATSDRMVMAIDADILLPFADRPSEVMDLLERVPKNRGLFDLLRDIFTPKDSSTSSASSSSASGATSPGGTERWVFSDVQKHLTTPREQLCDQDWIDILKAHVYPRSSILWERLRACLGVDVDDERGGDRYEELSSDIVMHPSPRLDAQPVSSPTTPGASSAYSGGGVPQSLASHLMSPRTVLSTQMGGMNLQPPPTSASNLSISPGTPNYSAVFSDTSASSLASPRQPFHTIGGGLSSASSGTRSPAREQGPTPSTGGTGSAMPRNHRRTSSGSSGFRRSLTMSSISENAPVNDFTHNPPDEDERADDDRAFYETAMSPPAPSSSNSTPAMTPSNSSQGLAGRVGLGDLLRLRGYPVDSIASIGSSDAAGAGLAYSSSSSSTGTTPAVSPQSAKIGLYGSTNAQAPGHLPPPSPMSPSLGSSPGSAFGAGTGASSALGLSLGSASSGRGGPAAGGVGSVGRPSPGFSSHRDARRTSYDEYAAVFESSDGESMSGRSVGRSLGRGPGMRFSFSDRADDEPTSPQKPKTSGFALAGLNLSKANSAQPRVATAEHDGSRVSTPT